MNLNFKTFVLVFIVFVVSCQEVEKPKEAPLARVYDKYLLPSDLKGLISKGTPHEDSILRVNNYIENWVSKQLMLKRAEVTLSTEQKDLTKEIDDYRTTILINRYKDKFINQKLDTVVSDNELNEFYEKHKFGFPVRRSVVKGWYLQVPIDYSKSDEVRMQVRTQNVEKIKLYATNKQFIFVDLSKDWQYLDVFFTQVNSPIRNAEELSRYYGPIESKDDKFQYFFLVTTKYTDTYIPLNLLKEDLRIIILNKRKIELLNNHETSLTGDAMNQKNVEVYTKNK